MKKEGTKEGRRQRGRTGIKGKDEACKGRPWTMDVSQVPPGGQRVSDVLEADLVQLLRGHEGLFSPDNALHGGLTRKKPNAINDFFHPHPTPSSPASPETHTKSNLCGPRKISCSWDKTQSPPWPIPPSAPGSLSSLW